MIHKPEGMFLTSEYSLFFFCFQTIANSKFLKKEISGLIYITYHLRKSNDVKHLRLSSFFTGYFQPQDSLACVSGSYSTLDITTTLQVEGYLILLCTLKMAHT